MSSIAFLISNPYQIHHYSPIAKHLGGVSFVVEHRDVDLGVTEELIRREVPHAHIEHTTYGRLGELDGRYEVIVCQTPVLPHRLLEQSLVVAEQYSLAKENYQYGVWRALCDLNLMYGQYSASRVSGFSSAVAVGNPALDGILTEQKNEVPVEEPSGFRSGLYMPTYGSLSSLRATLPRLAGLEMEFTVKLHHSADRSELPRLPDNCAVVFAETSPSDVLRAADFVISDYSGAAYDAVLVGLPVLLVGRTTAADSDHGRLSSAEIDGTSLGHVSARWESDEPIGSALEVAAARLHEHRAEFVRTRLANPGAAGPAAAAAIRDLVERGPDLHPAPQVRADTASMMRSVRDLSADNRRLGRQNDRLRRPSARRLHRVVAPVLGQVRRLVARTPWLERALVAMSHRVRGEGRGGGGAG
ncbi:MAG: hypothetical protein QNM02_07880 [Acidimicrobiia bacterium]|nr:hypothetical protein [Acidimicrobiia bacterium]